ncbi:MAG: Rpn family recombination-promoting nuclease/putative transposase [Thermoguttaceae bacterium]|nr:Rpn family recombination-promoting nuclease/putative transposase [Thermoguttaceae bacterium]
MTEQQPAKRVELYKDLVFRAIFGKESSKRFLKGLLNAVMEQAELPQITELTIKHPFTMGDLDGEKTPIMDISVVDEKGRLFDVEMQLQGDPVFGDRLFYYGARLYGRSLQKGERYWNLPPVVCVAFVNFPLSKEKPDVWFDKWNMRSVLGTGLGSNKMTNIFVRLPRVFRAESAPSDSFTTSLRNWVRIISGYSELTDEEIAKLLRETPGFGELRERVTDYYNSKEAKKVFDAQTDYELSIRGEAVVAEIERDKAIRERDQERRLREAAERERETAEREREAAERERDAAEQSKLETQRKYALRALRYKFGQDAELPEGWADGRSYDELEKFVDKVFDCKTFDEVLALL